MSELTWGVYGAGLLVFLVCSTKGCYIVPDQLGDIPLNGKKCAKKVVNGISRKESSRRSKIYFLGGREIASSRPPGKHHPDIFYALFAVIIISYAP